MFFFFFNDTATTEIYTLSLHDALPIWRKRRGGLLVGSDHGLDLRGGEGEQRPAGDGGRAARGDQATGEGRHACESSDRKSTRLNSSHSQISYAVFCLKKKKQTHRLVVQ